jgi:hypothetical protein
MEVENRISPKQIRQIKRSGFLEKISPSIPKDEEILNLQLYLSTSNRIFGYVFILMLPIVAAEILIFVMTVLDLEPGIMLPFVPWSWSFFFLSYGIALVAGVILELYFIFYSKRGYDIEILVFTNTAMYLFRNKEVGSVKYQNVKNIGFTWQGNDSNRKEFIISSDLSFQGKSTIDLAKFIYFLLYQYCNPKNQIKNRLKQKHIINVELETQSIIEKSKFEVSDTRFREIYRKKKKLLIKVFSFCTITAIVMSLVLIFLDSGYLILDIIIYVITIVMGGLVLYAFIWYGYMMNASLKQIVDHPYRSFEVGKEGIRATTSSGDVWALFENDLIINPYDCRDRIYISFYNVYDGIEFKKFDEKKVKLKLGPVEDHEFFYLIVLYHYVNWLYEHDLILSDDYVKEQYFLSDPFKQVIAEKIMIN